jgi:hypothetical protein
MPQRGYVPQPRVGRVSFVAPEGEEGRNEAYPGINVRENLYPKGVVSGGWGCRWGGATPLG